MKSCIAIILSLSILISSLAGITVFAAYQLNKEYISANLCENVSKKDNECKGRCHLRKELTKEEQKAGTPSGPVKEKNEFQFFCQHIYNTVSETGFLVFIFPAYHFNIPNAPPAVIFQPPKV